MTCRRCQEQLSLLLDGELRPSRARAVADHLAACAECVAVRDELAVLGGWLGHLDDPDVAGELPGGALASGLAPDEGERPSPSAGPWLGGAGPGDALWASIEAELDADRARAGRRRPGFAVLAPAMAGAALAATVAVATGARAIAARHGEILVDEALRAASGERQRRGLDRLDHLLRDLDLQHDADAHIDVTLRLTSPSDLGPLPRGPIGPGFEEALEASVRQRLGRLEARREAAIASAREAPPAASFEATRDPDDDASARGGR